MTGSKSVRKGKEFERKISKALSSWSGVDLRRTPMSGGWTVKGADLCHKDGTEFRIAVECKHVNGWDFHQIWAGKGLFYQWLDQTMQQATGRVPLLVFTADRRPVYVCIEEHRVAGLLDRYTWMRVCCKGTRFAIITLETFMECVPYGCI